MSKLCFKFVIVSKDDQFKLADADFKNLDNVKAVYVSNNKVPLTKIYNQHLAEIREKKDADILVFVHGDAYFDVRQFIAKISANIDKYDVIGLCGTEVVNVSQSPLNWFTGSNPTPSKRWGCVTHGELGDMMSYFSKDRANVLDHEVACIDGVCIAIGPKALADSTLNFDERFSFDLYDTDFSFQCLIEKKLKLGVVVEKSLTHYSVGRSILTNDFLVHELDFRKKWNLELPNGSRIQQLSIALRKNTVS